MPRRVPRPSQGGSNIGWPPTSTSQSHQEPISQWDVELAESLERTVEAARDARLQLAEARLSATKAEIELHERASILAGQIGWFIESGHYYAAQLLARLVGRGEAVLRMALRLMDEANEEQSKSESGDVAQLPNNEYMRGQSTVSSEEQTSHYGPPSMRRCPVMEPLARPSSAPPHAPSLRRCSCCNEKAAPSF